MSGEWWKICPMCETCGACEDCDAPCPMAMSFLNGQFMG